jgi:hypothetical protein
MATSLMPGDRSAKKSPLRNCRFCRKSTATRRGSFTYRSASKSGCVPNWLWGLGGKDAKSILSESRSYILLCLVFKRVYQGDGVSADCVQKKEGFGHEAADPIGCRYLQSLLPAEEGRHSCAGAGRPHVAAKIMETRIRSMRKDARLSDQVTAGTGSRVAEGCLKQGHLHLAAEPDLSSYDSWRTFLLK